jgi:hypothetical protein
MDPKIDTDVKTLPVPPGELLGPEMEVWDPPFERWMRIADELLGRSAMVPPKAAPKPERFEALIVRPGARQGRRD